MLFINGHGVTPVLDGDVAAYPDGKSIGASAVCGFAPGESYPYDPKLGAFAYAFPQADGLPKSADMTKKLDTLADVMVENEANPQDDSNIPPVFTYMGQFIDHDVTANTDRETGLSVIDVKTIVPVPRADVTAGLSNLRFGSLNLDSLYGDAPVQGAFAKAVSKAMRWTSDPAKLELGIDFDVPTGAGIPNAPIPVPADHARDLFRLGAALKQGQLSQEDLAKVPDELREAFINEDGSPRVQRALIGDMRNDENLAVAQFHLAMARLHNRVVDAAPASVPSHDRDAVHDWAKEKTQWIYQWLIMHAYLPAICDPNILGMIKTNGAQVYARLFEQNVPSHPDLMPMPLEFSIAAFRFGHTMARDAYDWNRNFGRGEDDKARATFQQLFRFTGNGMPTPRLPENWPIEWDRFVFGPTVEEPDRAARKLDTKLAPPLLAMDNEPDGAQKVLKVLPRRNLRRGYRLDVPSAQGCLKALKTDFGIDLPKLKASEIASGHTGKQVKDGDFDKDTPLWFYILKEAEVLCNGETLGPLGSLLVADTLIGLMECHPRSYLNAAPGGAAWQPKDSVKPSGVAIRDMPTMMKAALFL